MRLLIFLFVNFIMLGCSGQQTIDKVSSIDTLKLFDPFPAGSSGDDYLMFRNSIVLFQSGFTIIQDDKQNTFSEISEVSNYFSKNVQKIRPKKFFILIDSSTNFEKILSAIEILKLNGIGNYRVINIQEFKPSELVEIQTPTPVIQAPNLNDSTYLDIEILENSFNLNHRNKKVIAITSTDIDKFITENKSFINPSKIRIITSKESPIEKYKLVTEVFKKHNYMKYYMVTKPL